MEEKRTGKAHSLSWKDRVQGSVAGVTEVISFDESNVLLDTEKGRLAIKGKNLHISQLDLEKGEVELTGEADSFCYQGKGPKGKGNLLKRILQ